MVQARRMFASGNQPTIGQLTGAARVSRATFYRHFPSRTALLEVLDLAPEPGTRQRILEAAVVLLQQHTLAGLSMDDLAASAGVSRASVYRMFPGKAALFKAILLAYSPFEPAMNVLATEGQAPPAELIPKLVETAYRAVGRRTGLVRTLLLEITSLDPDTQAAFAETGLMAFATLARYLQAQMDAGRLRRMHPFLAVQALIGPVILHLLSAPLLPTGVAPKTSEESVGALARQWLRGMEARP